MHYNNNNNNSAVCHFPLLHTISVLLNDKQVYVKESYFHLWLKIKLKKVVPAILMWIDIVTLV